MAPLHDHVEKSRNFNWVFYAHVFGVSGSVHNRCKGPLLRLFRRRDFGTFDLFHIDEVDLPLHEVARLSVLGMSSLAANQVPQDAMFLQVADIVGRKTFAPKNTRHFCDR